MTPESIRDMLASAVKRAQAEADIRRFELEEYERANGFRASRLDASRAYREVTGRDAFAGAETYTRRSAEDIHD